MLERVRSAGLEMAVEGFTRVMSTGRLEGGAWSVHVRLLEMAHVLASVDPVFSDEFTVVGPPLRPLDAPSKPGTSPPKGRR